ncbi:hypothetical protein TGRH88_047970 [Toxoplasma gondii]|uniref:Uncharacterized protein n=1 Tax=Toxoplasma gondii TaxID=5811 RepID=A0A7J6K364_TOXGO|nr:hypothetical protein TGRH88_047970 [Toxoplasma gondii]
MVLLYELLRLSTGVRHEFPPEHLLPSLPTSLGVGKWNRCALRKSQLHSDGYIFMLVGIEATNTPRKLVNGMKWLTCGTADVGQRTVRGRTGRVQFTWRKAMAKESPTKCGVELPNLCAA